MSTYAVFSTIGSAPLLIGEVAVIVGARVYASVIHASAFTLVQWPVNPPKYIGLSRRSAEPELGLDFMLDAAAHAAQRALNASLRSRADGVMPGITLARRPEVDALARLWLEGVFQAEITSMMDDHEDDLGDALRVALQGLVQRKPITYTA